MKKYSIIGFMVLLPLLFLGAMKLPYISEGVYLVKLVNISHDDFFTEDITDVFQSANEACLIDSKPAELTVAPELEKLTDIKYGSFTLGNNEENVWFVMGKDLAGYYSKFYIDQNLDYNITTDEKAPPLETFDRRIKGIKVRNASAQWTPVPVTVSYKGINGVFKKKVYFYLWTGIFEKEDQETVTVTIATVSVLQGIIKIKTGKGEKLVKFRLLDTNSNACYNDYGKDAIYMDLNFDGKYSYQESQPLFEFFDIKSGDLKKQMRFLILPFPGKVGVIEVTRDFDPAQFEPEPDPV